MVNHLTICIPKVDNDIRKDFIFDVFNQYHFGKLKYVKIKKKNNISTAFVHYTYFNKDEKSQYVKKLLEDEKDIKIMYDMPWYWKCYISK